MGAAQVMSFPNEEAKPVGSYVRNVHPCNLGRMPDGLVLMSEGGADEVGQEGTVFVKTGRGSTVYGPARNWSVIDTKPSWQE